jgi:heme oxygenase
MPLERSGPDTPAFADRLREITRAVHRRAEQSGIVGEILRGTSSRHGYALYMRNLLPAYEQLERALERLRCAPMLQPLAQRAVYRSAALATDLTGLAGPRWAETLTLLPAGERYGARIAAVGADRGDRLIAHAYVRYLGDLNGGVMLRRLLTASLQLAPAQLNFYDYPEIADTQTFKRDYREAISAAGEIADSTAVADEVLAAFELSIAVSDAVHRHVGAAVG